MKVTNNFRLFLISFLFAYNGGLLKIILPTDGSIHFAQIVLALFGFLLSFKLKFFSAYLKKNRKILILLFLFTLYFYVHQFDLTPIYSKYKTDLLWWNLFAILFISTSIKSLKDFNLLIIFGMIQIAIGLIAGGIDFSSFRRGVGEPIVTSRLGGILVVYGLFYIKEKHSVLRFTLSFLGLLVVFLAGTRTLYISFALIFILMSFFNFEKGVFKINWVAFRKIQWYLFGIITIVVFLYINPFSLNIELIDRFYYAFNDLFSFTTGDETTLGRTPLWAVGFDIWKEYPIFGAGFGSFSYYLTNNDVRSYPHNIIIELLAEGGIVAFVIFVFLLRSIWSLFLSKLSSFPIYINKFVLGLLILGIVSSMTSLEIPNQFILFLSFSLIISYNNFTNVNKMNYVSKH